jgi:hypothetical protein
MPAQSKTAKSNTPIAVIGIDIGKNVFHLIGLDKRGAIVFKAKLSRSQLESQLANIPPCVARWDNSIGTELRRGYPAADIGLEGGRRPLAAQALQR